MNNQGFIKIFKKIVDWEWYRDSITSRVFLHCILKANWKESRFEGYDIPRGSFVTSYQKLADELSGKKTRDKISVQCIRTALKHLILTQELTVTKTSKFSIITINNYEKYQLTNTVPNSRLTQDQQSTNNNRRSKEIKNKRSVCVDNTSSPTPTLDELRSYCLENGMEDFNYEKFYNHYESNGWLNKNGTEIKNWKAKVRYWYKDDEQNGKLIKRQDTSRRLG